MLLKLPTLRTTFLGDGIFDDSISATAAGTAVQATAVTDAPVATVQAPTGPDAANLMWMVAAAIAFVGWSGSR